MGIFARYVDDRGRICTVFDGRGGVAEIEHNYSGECGCECALCAGGEGTMEVTMTAAELVDERIRAYQKKHPGTSYKEGYDVVLRADPVLAAVYAGVDPPDDPTPTDGGAVRFDDERVVLMREDGGSVETSGREVARLAGAQEVDRMAARAVEDGVAATYQEGVEKVLRAHPGLARQYAGLPGPSLEGDLRRIPSGQAVIVQHDPAGPRYHLHNAGGYAARDEKVQTPEQARKKLLALVRARQHESPADAMLAVLTLPEGRELLAIILKETE